MSWFENSSLEPLQSGICVPTRKHRRCSFEAPISPPPAMPLAADLAWNRTQGIGNNPRKPMAGHLLQTDTARVILDLTDQSPDAAASLSGAESPKKMRIVFPAFALSGLRSRPSTGRDRRAFAQARFVARGAE